MDDRLRQLERAYLSGDTSVQCDHERLWRAANPTNSVIHFVSWEFHNRIGLCEMAHFDTPLTAEEIDAQIKDKGSLTWPNVTSTIHLRCGHRIHSEHYWTTINTGKQKQPRFSKFEEFVTCKTCQRSVASMRRMFLTNPPAKDFVDGKIIRFEGSVEEFYAEAQL